MPTPYAHSGKRQEQRTSRYLDVSIYPERFDEASWADREIDRPFFQIDARYGICKQNGSVRSGPTAQPSGGEICSGQQVLDSISFSVASQITERLLVRQQFTESVTD